jgi:2-dehydro-3-deoxy-D-arabinonate dehydratase
MKLLQYHDPGEGKRVGVLTREGAIIDVTTDEAPGVLELLQVAAADSVSLNILVAEMQERASAARPAPAPWEQDSREELSFEAVYVAPTEDGYHLRTPIDSPEVWGCGVTYKRSSDMRDDDSESDIYSRIYAADRPEIFFKATPRCIVGSNQPIGIRRDSKLTATEPELAFVMGEGGEIVGYTLCNDVSAWDIERENPLYLPQSKMYNGCCALGPTFVTPAELDDPYNLDISCVIRRAGATLWEGSVNTEQINWKLEDLAEYLMRDNDCPVGTVVSTGTGIIVPNDLPLQAGDIVDISCDELGTLSNPVVQFG